VLPEKKRPLRQPITITQKKSHVLERIRGSLPLATYLNADTYALVDIFCPTLIVDAELQSVSVFELERARVLVGRRKADVVEERAGAALGILDEKLATEFAPDLRVGARNDL